VTLRPFGVFDFVEHGFVPVFPVETVLDGA